VRDVDDAHDAEDQAEPQGHHRVQAAGQNAGDDDLPEHRRSDDDVHVDDARVA
jgi:hypothetical protein